MLRSAMARSIENPEQYPLLVQRPEERVIGPGHRRGTRSVRGVRTQMCCGARSSFCARRVNNLREVIAIAKKSRDAFRKRSWKVVGEYVDITTRADLGKAQEIAAEVMKIL